MDYSSTTQAVFVDPCAQARPNQERTHIPRKEALDKQFWKSAEDEVKEYVSKLAKEQYHSDAQWCSEATSQFRTDGSSASPSSRQVSNQAGDKAVTIYTYQSHLRERGAKDILEYLRDELCNEIDISKHDHLADVTLRTPTQVKRFFRPYRIDTRLTQLQLHVVAGYLASLGITGNEILHMLTRNSKPEEESQKTTRTYSVSYSDENERLHEAVLEVRQDERFPHNPSFPQDLVRSPANKVDCATLSSLVMTIANHETSSPTKGHHHC